jgi:CheY-like chemotaxis protein
MGKLWTTDKQDKASAMDCEGLRVLVVDDDAGIRTLLKVALELAGADVTVADSARKALDLFKVIKPAVLVSDLAMPQEDGYWLIHNIRDLPSPEGQTPAIAVTAHAIASCQLVLDSGFQAWVKKPFLPEELSQLVAALAGRAA